MPTSANKEHQDEPHNNTPVRIASAALVILFSALTLLFPDISSTWLNAAKQWSFDWFDWLYAITPIVVLSVCIFLAVSSFGRIKLGGANAEPEFSAISWIAMLFAAGVGIGFMFYGAAEPLAYYTNWSGTPLSAEAGSPQARRFAFSATLFHWGIAPWGIYAIMGLSLGFFAYNRKLPLTIRSIFYPVLGKRIWGWQGQLIDTFAVISTIFGLATTIGIGATQAGSGFSYLFNITDNTISQVLIIITISCFAIISVFRGVNGGIKLLSNLNIALAIILLVSVILFGPTAKIASSTMVHFIDYLIDMTQLSNWVDRSDEEWFHSWTIFYWAWWISWSPFVGMFIARISRGRTVRQYFTAVILVPFAVALVWFTAFGETAISQYENGLGGLADGVSSASLTLFQMLKALPLFELTSLIAMVLLIIFIVTSADSGALVVEQITTTGDKTKASHWRSFWVIVIGFTSIALLYGGGTTALQTLQAATIVAALPFTVLVLVSCVSLCLSMGKERQEISKAHK